MYRVSMRDGIASCWFLVSRRAIRRTGQEGELNSLEHTKGHCSGQLERQTKKSYLEPSRGKPSESS